MGGNGVKERAGRGEEGWKGLMTSVQTTRLTGDEDSSRSAGRRCSWGSCAGHRHDGRRNGSRSGVQYAVGFHDTASGKRGRFRVLAPVLALRGLRRVPAPWIL